MPCLYTSCICEIFSTVSFWGKIKDTELMSINIKTTACVFLWLDIYTMMIYCAVCGSTCGSAVAGFLEMRSYLNSDVIPDYVWTPDFIKKHAEVVTSRPLVCVAEIGTKKTAGLCAKRCQTSVNAVIECKISPYFLMSHDLQVGQTLHHSVSKCLCLPGLSLFVF